MGRSKYDLYAGIDVQANGYNTPIKWNYLFPEGEEANTSLGLYCPSWTYDSSSSVEEFLEKEERFYSSYSSVIPKWVIVEANICIRFKDSISNIF